MKLIDTATASGYSLACGDCRDVLRTLPDNSVDSIVTDPPYELGFMGKAWDSTGIAYDVTVWRECLRVLKPGGHLLAFGGSRTYHRLACAVEDAGFEIRDQIQWVYGSGFPKSLDVSKAIDKAAGFFEKRGSGVVVDRTALDYGGATGKAKNGLSSEYGQSADPITDAAREWAGWGTALKPAHEPIVMARKPLIGTVADNVQTWGTGAINVAGCRVLSADARTYGGNSDGSGRARTGGQQNRKGCTADLEGHSLLREQRSDLPASARERGRPPTQPQDSTGGYRPCLRCGGAPARHAQDVALASVQQQPGAREPLCRCTTGPSTLESLSTYEPPAGDYTAPHIEITARWPANLIHDGSDEVVRLFPNDAARFFYCAKASKRDRDDGLEDRNTHATVKPTDLMRYLCRLVTPAGGVVLDPFAGSGSTGKAAILECFRFIGIELEPDHVAIAEARIAHVAAQVQML